MRKFSLAILFFVIIFTVILDNKAFTQNTIVTVGGEVEKPLKLDAEVIGRMKHVDVRRASHSDNKEHLYSGIPLYEILYASGAIP